MLVNSEDFEGFMKIIISRFDKLDKSIERLLNRKDALNGDELLDNQDMCQLLGVTKRTLQRYRQKGILTFYTLDNRKPYYLKSEIPEFLIANRRKNKKE
ncbi:helix-turn-helix domain-containing protein [Dysgonomonas sp. 25]|uniref:helix-turn-helix domain-containing protein n=1 Tax=Dysgonomonas sp. 25 TaxID=2302933 RepID=UPI0013D4C3DA|nr:helix-turn-helix domain-containing protein [Dysgonomonas sp. 25]NDV70024.1 DNA-binding protein [Dysgonomonas sp. 25]